MTRSIFLLSAVVAATALVVAPFPVSAEEAGPFVMPLPIPKPDAESTFNLTPKAKKQFVAACASDGEPVAVCTCLINGIEEYIPPLDFVKFGLAQAEGREPDPTTGARIDRIYQACVARAESAQSASPEGEETGTRPSGTAPAEAAPVETAPPSEPADAATDGEKEQTPPATDGIPAVPAREP